MGDPVKSCLKKKLREEKPLALLLYFIFSPPVDLVVMLLFSRFAAVSQHFFLMFLLSRQLFQENDSTSRLIPDKLFFLGKLV